MPSQVDDSEPTRLVSLSAGHGASRLEVHCAGATATVESNPGGHPPLFTYRDGIVLVDR